MHQIGGYANRTTSGSQCRSRLASFLCLRLFWFHLFKTNRFVVAESSMKLNPRFEIDSLDISQSGEQILI